jgi:hypothetical protein
MPQRKAEFEAQYSRIRIHDIALRKQKKNTLFHVRENDENKMNKK